MISVRSLATYGLVVLVACGSDSGSSDDESSSGAPPPDSSAPAPEVDAGPARCKVDDECKATTGRPVCDASSGECVPCTSARDVCPAGSYCTANNTCETGCASNAGCKGNADGRTFCNVSSHTCVTCLSHGDCIAGEICNDHACVPGCTPDHACAAGDTCCDGTCVDTNTDVLHCGSCQPCVVPANATPSCTEGKCGFACEATHADCNVDSTDGCEWDITVGGACVCAPGATESCYTGPAGTAGVGTCKTGVHTCEASGTSWGACEGEVVPVDEICANNQDEDCDGIPDNGPDGDGDGWTRCNGDCCETTDCAPNPALVNPGAYDIAGDGRDNDCDGTVDNARTCSTATKFTGVTGNDVARAMGLCQTTTENPAPRQKQWGLISAQQLLANGMSPTNAELSDIMSKQTAVSTLFGHTITPTQGNTLALISTGMARDAQDPGWVNPITGTQFSTSITFPGDGPLARYLGAHNNALVPGRCGVATCATGTGAQDSVDIQLRVRVPTNAVGFRYAFRFFSSEYQTFQCTQYNDYFLSILTSAHPSTPADGNIALDSAGNAISVNTVELASCGGNSKGCNSCPAGTSALAGTGFDVVNGSATPWLDAHASVVPGETITLDIMLFDVSDHIYDTTVLLDDFRWEFAD